MSKTITNKLELIDNEAVIKRMDQVGYGKKGLSNGGLILTDKALIYQKKNLFGILKEVYRFPLEEIRVADGKPQVQASNPDGFTPMLDVYFQDGLESFRFTFDQHADEWVDAVWFQLTGVHIKQNDDFAWVEDLAGMADSLAGGINKIKSSLGIKSTEQVSANCQGCGASITGIRGEAVQCPYCGKYTTL